MGYRVVHLVEMYACIPFGIAFVVLAGYAASGLKAAANVNPLPPGTPGQILSYAATLIPFGLAWAALASDYTVYAPEHSSAWGHGLAVFGGCYIGMVPLELLGAAILASVSGNVSWEAGFAAAGLPGVLGAVIQPAGKCRLRHSLGMEVEAQILLAQSVHSFLSFFPFQSAQTIYHLHILLV